MVEHLVTTGGRAAVRVGRGAGDDRAAARQPGLHRLGHRRATAPPRACDARPRAAARSDSRCSTSGMLRPKKSLLAVFALTRHRDRAASATDLVPCTMCAFGPCQFRRAPVRACRERRGRQAGRDRAATPPRRVAYVTPMQGPAPVGGRTADVDRRHDETPSRPRSGTTARRAANSAGRSPSTTASRWDRVRPASRFARSRAGRRTATRATARCASTCSQGDALLSAIANETPLLGQPLDHIIGVAAPTHGRRAATVMPPRGRTSGAWCSRRFTTRLIAD